MKKEVDKFGRGKQLPRCIFKIKWTEHGEPIEHDEVIQIDGTITPISITVECVAPGMYELPFHKTNVITLMLYSVGLRTYM